jgi:hypothetical protein
MHSAEVQAEWEAVEGLDEHQLKAEVVELRREIKDLKAELDNAWAEAEAQP